MKFNADGKRVHDIYDTVDECWAENKQLRAENGRLRAELDEALYAVDQLQNECRQLIQMVDELTPKDEIPF